LSQSYGRRRRDQSKIRTRRNLVLPLHRTDDEGLARLEEKEKYLKALRRAKDAMI